jgi:FMN phosphatase YigB (HAD superfamily)
MDIAAAREVARHRYLTLARVNGEIDTELETFRTLRDRQELQGVRVQERYLGVIDKWIGYAETALEEANRKDFRQVHWAEYSMVITFERYLQEANEILEENLCRDTFEPEAKFPESYERSAHPYTPRSNIPSLIEELEEEEDLLPSFPAPPSTEVASVNNLKDYPSRLSSSHDALDQSGTDKSES